MLITSFGLTEKIAFHAGYTRRTVEKALQGQYGVSEKAAATIYTTAKEVIADFKANNKALIKEILQEEE